MKTLACEMEAIFEEPEMVRYRFRQPCIFREPSFWALETTEQPRAHDVSRPSANEEAFLLAFCYLVLQLTRDSVQRRDLLEVLELVFPQSSWVVFAEGQRPVLDLVHESKKHGTDVVVARLLTDKIFSVVDG
jgi:hypothetical protein